MLELCVFLVVLAIIRGLHRRKRAVSQPSTRIDIYHHWSGGGPGETWPRATTPGPTEMSAEELAAWQRDWSRAFAAAHLHEAAEPLLLTERVDNVVPLHRRGQ